MPDPLDELDYYALFGVERGASSDEIRNAFHTFALRYHPDRHVGEGGNVEGRAERVYSRGAEAYRVLLDPLLRRTYDEGLERGERRLKPEHRADGASSGRPHARSSLRAPPMKSAQARPFFQKAEKAIAVEDWKQARLHLQIAQGHEPNNPVLEARLKFVLEKLGK